MNPPNPQTIGKAFGMEAVASWRDLLFRLGVCATYFGVWGIILLLGAMLFSGFRRDYPYAVDDPDSNEDLRAEILDLRIEVDALRAEVAGLRIHDCGAIEDDALPGPPPDPPVPENP
jgi:hypothetical protein